MGELLAVLMPIAFLDGTSMVPVAVVPMAVFLSSKRPYLGGIAFCAGIFLPYFGAGVLLALGLDTLLGALSGWAQRFYTDPRTWELIAQIAIGIAALWFGAGMVRAPEQIEKRDPGTAADPAEAFVFGAGIVLVGLPGALPYFAAIDQILRADLGPGTSITALIFYNLVIVLPLLAMLAVHAALGGRARPLFDRIAELAGRWGPRLFALLLLMLGVVLVADGIGFLLGYPLLPVGEVASG